MTPPPAAFLRKARSCVADGRAMLGIKLTDDAGRMAYMAAFHAALALIRERTGKVPKTHRGVHAEFARLAQLEPTLDPELRAFPSRSYALKTVADYETAIEPSVSIGEVEEALAISEQLTVCVESLIGPASPATDK